MLATGFVTDSPGDGTDFPSAGGRSDDARVQAVYWRSLVALFASARFSNPQQRLALFTNVAPPTVDGVDIGQVLQRYRVEVRNVPLTARLPAGATRAWGNVLYYHDIMESLAQSEASDLRIALVDSDVLVTGPLCPLFALLDSHDFAGYTVDITRPDEMINGLSMPELTEIARALGASNDVAVPHIGGELLLASVGSWIKHREFFAGLLNDAMTGTGPARGVITEEHVFTVAFAVLRGDVASANHLMKRIWTTPRLNTVRPGDENLTVWHLPAEKRYGLKDLFDFLQARQFPETFDPDAFRATAGRLCGIPRKSARKIVRDGLRRITAKTGLIR